LLSLWSGTIPSLMLGKALNRKDRQIENGVLFFLSHQPCYSIHDVRKREAET